MCQSYAVEYGLSYDIENCMHVCQAKCAENIYVHEMQLNGKYLKWTNKHKYLGVLISNDLKDADICRQLRSLYIQGNILLKFKRCSNEVKYQRFRSYCTNLYYCASLWCNYKGTTL